MFERTHFEAICNLHIIIIPSTEKKIKDFPSKKESTPPYDSSNFLTHGERRLSLADYLLLLKHVGRNQVGFSFFNRFIR